MGGVQIVRRSGHHSNRIRIAVFFSGSGTGMNALLNHQKKNECIHETVVCFTDKENSGGIDFAKEHNIPTVIEPVDVQLPKADRRLEHEGRILKHLEKYDVDLIILSGYMRLLSPVFVEKYYPRIINIHPSLLPAFPGADAHTDVLSSGVRVSGCTVHIVDSGMDSGPVLAQQRVPVFETDTRELLARRIQIEEHRIYPEIIDLICSGHRFDLGN